MPKGIYIRTKHYKIKDTSNMGRKKGSIPWNKGKKTGFAPWRGKKRPNISGKNHPLWGKPRSQKTIEKIKQRLKGRKCNDALDKWREENNGGFGKNHWNWQGGITPLELKIRHFYKYRQWVSDVFTKDGFTCQDCGVRGGRLEAHHIKLFSKILAENNIKTLEEALNCAELWDINNGITYCRDYHRKKVNHKRL